MGWHERKRHCFCLESDWIHTTVFLRRKLGEEQTSETLNCTWHRLSGHLVPGESVHTHIYTHTYTHIYTHTYIHAHTHTYTHICAHIHIYSDALYTHIHTQLHIYTHIYTHNYIYTHIHTYTYMCIHMKICACVCIYAYVYIFKGFPGGSGVKNLPADAGATGDSGLITVSGRSPQGSHGNPPQYILAWKIPWTEESGGLQYMGVTKSRHDWAAKRACTHIIYICTFTHTHTHTCTHIHFCTAETQCYTAKGVSHTHTYSPKTNSEWIKDLKVKSDSKKVLRPEHGQNTLWHKLQQDLFWPTSQNDENKNKSKQMGSNEA